MATRTLSITMSGATLGALQQSGFHLYAFRPVTSSNKSGVPLVWQRLDSYLQTTPLSFVSEALSAYISTDNISIDGTITVGASEAVSLGQIVSVDTNGNLTAADGAPTGDVYIASGANTNFTCGLAAPPAGMLEQPFCAFTLYPQVAVTMQPADAIFVMWATSTYDPAVYMQQSLGPGLLVGFGDATVRAVSYDIKLGWQADSAIWALPVTPGSNLVATLIFDPGPNHPTYR